MTAELNQFPQHDEASAHMQELIDQIELDNLGDGIKVSDNKHLKLAQAHGLGYLTGMAEGMLSSTTVQAEQDENYTNELWEADMLVVIDLCLLAIVSNRLSSASELADETSLPPIQDSLFSATIHHSALFGL